MMLAFRYTAVFLATCIPRDGFPENIQAVDIAAMFNQAYPLNKRVNGVHGELMWSPIRYGDPLLPDIYREIGFQDMRLPGGTANYYLWQTANFGCNRLGPLGDKSQDRIKRYNAALSRENRTYTTEDFLSFIKQSDSDFTLLINVLCDTPDNTRKWMEKIRSSGITVKYAELGSEYYFEEYLWAFPYPSDYIREAQRHAAEIKRVFPDVKLGLDASVSSYRSKDFPDFAKMAKDKQHRRGLGFDRLSASAPFADALVVHIYSPLGTTRMDHTLDSVDYDSAYKNAVAYFDNRFRPSVQYLHGLNPDKAIWITEWGMAFYGWLRSHQAGFLRSYYNALYVMNALLTYFSIPYIESANYHNFPYLWSDLETLQPNPLYHAIKLLKEPVQQSESISPVQLTGIMTYGGTRPNHTNGSPELNAAFFHSENNGYLFIVNKLQRHYSLRSFTSDHATDIRPIDLVQIRPEKPGSPSSENVARREQRIAKESSIDIPPYSISRIRVQFGSAIPTEQSGQQNGR